MSKSKVQMNDKIPNPKRKIFITKARNLENTKNSINYSPYLMLRLCRIQPKTYMDVPRL
jgi:hypothetical protein